MKKIIFIFLDEFCYSELIADDVDPNWFKPTISYNGFVYDSLSNKIFFNGELQDTITSIFGVDRTDFRSLMKEWFEDRYKLKVSDVL
jgi:hypothetical protein